MSSSGYNAPQPKQTLAQKLEPFFLLLVIILALIWSLWMGGVFEKKKNTQSKFTISNQLYNEQGMT